MFPSPRERKYGAKGDGEHDDTAALQGWLDAIEGGAGILEAGRYRCTSALMIGGPTTIYGAGNRAAIIVDAGDQYGTLLRNRTFVHGDFGIADRGINIYGVGFEGDTTVDLAANSFVDFVGVDSLTLRDCRFAHRSRDLLVLGWVNNMTIDACEFEDWGSRIVHDSPGSGTYVGGMAIFCVYPCFRSRIVNCNLHDAAGGGGIWLPVSSGSELRQAEAFSCRGNSIRGVVEAGIVGAPDGSDISGNDIADVYLVDVSGHAMELHGHCYTVRGNTIRRCDNMGIFMLNSSCSVVSGNAIDDTGCPIALATLSGGGLHDCHQEVTVDGNQLSNTGGRASHAMIFANWTGDIDKRMKDVRGVNNYGNADQWHGAAIECMPTRDLVVGPGFSVT